MPEINIGDIQDKIQNQTGNQFDPSRGINISNVTTPETLFTKAIYVLIWVIGVAAVLVLIWAGFSYMTAGGDAEKAERAKKMIVGTIIGIIIIVASFLIYTSILRAVNGLPFRTSSNQIVREA